MNIYEFYSTEVKRLSDEKESREKAEAEARAKKEREFKEEIKILFLSSLKAMFEWSKKVTETMPVEAYDFITSVINHELTIGANESDLSILIKRDMISCRSSDDVYSFLPEEPFSLSDYSNFAEKTNFLLNLVIYPASPDFIHVELWTEKDYSDSFEEMFLLESLQELYGNNIVSNFNCLSFDIEIDKINS